jgi:5-methylthioadenosine/S-adenosylhomocysteine deaminase
MSILLKNVYALDGFMERANLCDLVVNNGEISAIYNAGKCPVRADETVDGKGRTAVIPGFVNGHTHAAMSLLRGLGEEKPLMEWLKEQIWPVEANLTPEHIYWGTKLAILEMASRGITCFADMYFEMWNEGRSLQRAHRRR